MGFGDATPSRSGNLRASSDYWVVFFVLFWLVVVLMLLLFGFVLFCFVWNFVIWILFAWDLCVLFWGVNVKVFFVF